MSTWVYFFSKFTPEMLLLEAFCILLLIAGYAGFYTLRKRKHGAVDDTVPSGVVKGYLNDLIQDAHRIRAQLFGLLGDAGMAALDGVQPASGQAIVVRTVQVDGATDAATLAKLQALESKMGEQITAYQQVFSEKVKLEEELKRLREAAGSAPAPAAGASGGGDSDMAEKLAGLEARLAEYSIIEDDLANLKRLQQENNQLRAALEGKGGAPSGASVAPPAPVAAPAPTPVAAAPAAPSPLAAADKIAEKIADQAAAPAGAQAKDPFEGIVDEVEKTLENAAQAVSAAPAEEIVAEAATPPPAEAADSKEKSDADLVEEFEKMLNA